MPLSKSVSIAPIDPALDGKSFFAAIYSKSFSGIALIDARTGHYRKIKRFSNPDRDQPAGDFDGRWLVWTEYHRLDNMADFTVWSWDSRNGRLRRLGEAKRAPSGEPWPSAWENAKVLDGYATWEQGTSGNRTGEVHVVNLRNGRDRIVATGHVGSSIIVEGPIVIWPQKKRLNLPMSPIAADAKTGRRVKVPAAFWHSHGLPATDGRSVIESDGGWLSLWWSPALNKETRRVFDTGKISVHVENPFHIAGRYVTFSTDAGSSMYIADAAKGRYMKIRQGAGWTVLNRRAFVITKARPGEEDKKEHHPIMHVIFIPMKSPPPFPACMR